MQLIHFLHHTRAQLLQAGVMHRHQLTVGTFIQEHRARGKERAAPDWHPPGSISKNEVLLVAQAHSLLTQVSTAECSAWPLHGWGSCNSWILCWLLSMFSLRASKWAMAICANDTDSILVIIKNQSPDSPWESIAVHVLCPACRTKLCITHEFSTCAWQISSHFLSEI